MKLKQSERDEVAASETARRAIRSSVSSGGDRAVKSVWMRERAEEGGET